MTSCNPAAAAAAASCHPENVLLCTVGTDDDSTGVPATSALYTLSARDDDDSSHRGFGTSISSIFAHLEKERTDMCSVVCCGMLQLDRNRHLLLGYQPVSSSCWSKRMIKTIMIPSMLLIVAYMFCYRISLEEPMGELVAIALVCFFLLYIIILAMQGHFDRKRLRQELLWQKHQRRTNRNNPSKSASMDVTDVDDDYYHGQSNCDIACAYMCLGCYQKDQVEDRRNRLPPTNCLSRVSDTFSLVCCGACGCYVQVCGVCAVAQEARDIEAIVSQRRLKMDYVTMQPVLQYYKHILESRVRGKGTGQHFGALSTLSKQVIHSWLVGFVLVILAGVVWAMSILDIVYVMAILMTQILLGLLLSWFNMKVISFDLCVKAFTCGFALAATTAFVWEAGFSLVVRIVTSIILQEDFYDYSIHSSNGGVDASASAAPIDLFGRLGDRHPWWYMLYLFLYSFLVAALLEELCKYLGYRMISDHADFWTKRELDETVHATKNADQLEDLSLGSHSISSMTSSTEVQNFSQAERTTILLVAMIQVALGFTTFENLIYSFLDAPAVTRRCLWRAFFPIHALCAFWQGIRVGRRDVENDLTWQLGRIILPSVLLHGTFDFLMGLAHFLGRANQTRLVGEITTALIAISLLIAGGCCSWIEYAEQRRRLSSSGSPKRGGGPYLSPIESGGDL